jgi:hypothetical protein
MIAVAANFGIKSGLGFRPQAEKLGRGCPNNVFSEANSFISSTLLDLLPSSPSHKPQTHSQPSSQPFRLIKASHQRHTAQHIREVY